MSIIHPLQGDTFRSQHALQAAFPLLFLSGALEAADKLNWDPWGRGWQEEKWPIPASTLPLKTSGFAFAGYYVGFTSSVKRRS